jgi:hypothetical protein
MDMPKRIIVRNKPEVEEPIIIPRKIKRPIRCPDSPVSNDAINYISDKIQLISIEDSYNTMDDDKSYIIDIFNKNIRGITIDTSDKNMKHCGKEGHWLESRMGIIHNSKNEPDIRGYEMKKGSSKITLGDFSASEYAFSREGKRERININNNWTNENASITRTQFIRYFGNPNPEKNNRYSWSGRCVPTYNEWNANGQILSISDDNDIIIYYSYSKDTRDIKESFPNFLKSDHLMIAIWYSEKMESHINKKFNKKGFFMCKKVGDTYNKICFGKIFNFNYVIECIKNKKIIFDSGMYEGNSRNYSQFRGSGSCFWNELIIEEY